MNPFEKDKDYEQWIQDTRQKVEAGLAELDQGRGISGETVIARLRERLYYVRENKR